MNPISNLKTAVAAPRRHWLAKLELQLERRRERTVMTHMRHSGPLRVQRAFYPEADGCSHLYILHPPGGLVMGDELRLQATLGEHGQALLTTPSAGKLYNSANQDIMQRQHCEFFLQDHSCLEWLPQETIVFNGAKGELSTRIHLQGQAKFFCWDIVRLGRVAGNQPFVSGYCQQEIAVFKNGYPLFIERLPLRANSAFISAPYGLRSANTLATLLCSVELSKRQLEQLILNLEALDANFKQHWGVTHKPQLLIVRYLGDSVSCCRKGLTLAWQFLRPHFCGKSAVLPRIWHT